MESTPSNRGLEEEVRLKERERRSVGKRGDPSKLMFFLTKGTRDPRRTPRDTHDLGEGERTGGVSVCVSRKKGGPMNEGKRRRGSSARVRVVPPCGHGDPRRIYRKMGGFVPERVPDKTSDIK